MSRDEPLADDVGEDIVQCAMCHVSRRSSVVMIPASLTCPELWTVEYGGYLMSSYANAFRRSAVCVDRDPDSAACGDGRGDGNRALFYHMEAGYPGLEHYDPEKELTCVVCSK